MSVKQRLTHQEKISRRLKWLIGIVVGAIGLLILGNIGWRKWHWLGGKQADPQAQFGEKLDGRYVNPSGTFMVDFPVQPTMVALGEGEAEKGLINYYAVDLKTKVEYRVSQIKQLSQLLAVNGKAGMRAEDLVMRGSNVVAEMAARSFLGEGAKLMILQHDDQPQKTGVVTMELEMTKQNSSEQTEKYGLTKLWAKDDNLWIVSAIGARAERGELSRFVNSFDLLQTENNDQNDFDLDEIVEPELQRIEG
jgi:hypothetical protein